MRKQMIMSEGASREAPDNCFEFSIAVPSPHAPFGRSPLYFLRLMIAHKLLSVRKFRTLGF